MAKPTVNSVTQASNKLQRQYEAEYAGQLRHTRSIEPLERLISKSTQLLKKAKKLKGEKGRAVQDTVRQRLALYKGERDKIGEAIYEKPEIREAHQLGQQANRVMWRYRRFFMGRHRATRDLVLLDELIAELASIEPRLSELAQAERKLELTASLNTLRTQSVLMEDERKEIVNAQQGLEGEEKESALASVANVRLDLYRVHFAKQSRLSVDPARLDALVASVRQAITPLRPPACEGRHAERVQTLDAELLRFTAEAEAIRETQKTSTVRDRSGHLGAAANGLFEVYREQFAGQDRRTRDLRLLADVCERLSAIRQVMADMDVRFSDTGNAKNLAVVTERHTAYEKEWLQVFQAQMEAARTQGQGQGKSTTGSAPGRPPSDPLAGLIRVDDD